MMGVAMMAEVRRFFEIGGVVMWPLMAVGVLLWYFMGLRLFYLRRGLSGDALEALKTMVIHQRELPELSDAGLVGGALVEIRKRLKKNGGLVLGEVDEILRRKMAVTTLHSQAIKTLVALAPLLGLLGTVHGMIETFRALQDMALFSESGGVSGGISEALVTTQMGLGLAIPGLIMARVLDRRARGLRRDLAAIQGAAQGVVSGGNYE